VKFRGYFRELEIAGRGKIFDTVRLFELSE
jgi:hypothetical protein